MSATTYPAPRIQDSSPLAWATAAAFRPLHALIVEPSLLFLATLALMLFHPPDFSFHSIDRFAFGLLILIVLLRACVVRQPLQIRAPVTWPMLALLLLALYGVVSQPNDAETWSLFAAKWLVPFTLFQLAAYIFDDARSLRRFETFALIVLGYLSLTAIFFMIDAKQFIFPRYILDESLGYHADRARTLSAGRSQRCHAEFARSGCAKFIPAQTTARSAGTTLSSCIAAGYRCHQDPRCLAVFCPLSGRFAFLFSQPTTATCVPLLRACCRHWTRRSRHIWGP